MNIINLIGFSLDGMFRKKLKTLALIILFAFSMVIMATVMLLYKVANYSYDSVDGVLSRGVKNTGTVSVNEMIQDDRIMMEFQKRLYDSKKIEAVGMSEIHSNAAEYVKELHNIQYGNVDFEYSDYFGGNKNENTFFDIDMDYYAINLYNIKLQKGEFINNLVDEDVYHHVSYLYLGSAFADIPIGTEYKITERYTLKVAGILKSGAECGIDSIISESYNESCVIPLDYMAIVVRDYGWVQSQMLFSAAEGYSIDEAVSEVRDIAANMNIGVSVGTLEGMFEEKNRFQNMVNDILFELMIVIVIIAVIIQSCIQVADILGYSHQYGILYAVGANQKDVSFIISLESFIRFIAAACIALAGEMLIIRQMYPDASMCKIAQDIFISTTVVWMLLAGIAMTAVSTVVPVIMIRLNKPAKLINKQE